MKVLLRCICYVGGQGYAGGWMIGNKLRRFPRSAHVVEHSCGVSSALLLVVFHVPAWLPRCEKRARRREHPCATRLTSYAAIVVVAVFNSACVCCDVSFAATSHPSSNVDIIPVRRIPSHPGNFCTSVLRQKHSSPGRPALSPASKNGQRHTQRLFLRPPPTLLDQNSLSRRTSGVV